MKRPRSAPPPSAAGVVGAQRGRPRVLSGRGRTDPRWVPGAPRAAGLAARPGPAARPPPAPRRDSVCVCFSHPPRVYPLVPGARFTGGLRLHALSGPWGCFCECEGEKKKTGKGQFPVSSPLILHARAQINLGKASRRESNSNLKNLLIKAGFRNSIPLHVLAWSPGSH